MKSFILFALGFITAAILTQSTDVGAQRAALMFGSFSGAPKAIAVSSGGLVNVFAN